MTLAPLASDASDAFPLIFDRGPQIVEGLLILARQVIGIRNSCGYVTGSWGDKN